MSTLTRRSFLEMATVLGASAAWGNSSPSPSGVSWHERRELYPEGVASGDPDSNSVLLWTRRPPASGKAIEKLIVEVYRTRRFGTSSPCRPYPSPRLLTGLVACWLAV